MHKISALNIQNRTAICTICGPTNVYYRGRDAYRCKTPVALRARLYKQRARYGVEYGDVPLDTPCKICCKFGKRMVYDHSHVTGEHRGWLCSDCNLALGLVYDDPKILESAIEYLKIADSASNN